MFRVDVVKGTTDVSVPIHVMDSTDGSDETAYAHDSTGIDMWYRREGGSEVSITEAALAAWNSAHTDGGVEHGADGRGRLDLPDAACAVGTDGATYCEYGGHIDGMLVTGGIVQFVDPVASLFSSVPIGDTGNTTTTLHIPSWTYADDEPNNDGLMIGVYDVSESEWHLRLVLDWVNSTKLATVDTLPFTPANSTDLVVQLGAMPWPAAWDAEVQSEAGDAISAFFSTLDEAALQQIVDDLENGGRLDLIFDAIKAVTDALPDSGALTTLLANVAAILDDTGTSGVAISATGADAVLDEVVEGSYTMRHYLRLFASALLGKASGLGTTTAVYRDTADTKDRISATVDADGNRTAVTLTET